MKTTFFVPVLMLLVLSSCQSIRVASDYDKEANFTSYKTYAFLKKGIGQVEINDLDKKRILRSIENALITKGFSASENPCFFWVCLHSKEPYRQSSFQHRQKTKDQKKKALQFANAYILAITHFCVDGPIQEANQTVF